MLLASDAQEDITYREVLLFEHFAHKAYFSSKMQLCGGHLPHHSPRLSLKAVEKYWKTFILIPPSSSLHNVYLCN